MMRHYDLRQLRGIHRIVKQLFPADPFPALAFPKPSQQIRPVLFAEDFAELPAFPKPWQIEQYRRDQSPLSAPRVMPAAVAPGPIEGDTPAARYMQSIFELAQNELAYAAIQEEFETVFECFGIDHELFARGYAQYLADGKATEQLRRVYGNFSCWLALKQEQGGEA